MNEKWNSIKYISGSLHLTRNASISQEKIPSQFLRYSQFCTKLVAMMVKKVLPDDSWPSVSSTVSPEQPKEYELKILVSYPQSWVIVQNDLWVEPNPRLNSHFASKAHVNWILSLKNLTGMFTFLRAQRAWSGSNGVRKHSAVKILMNAHFNAIF